MVCRTEICLEAAAEQSHCTATPAARTRCHLCGGGGVVVDHFAPLQRGNRLQHSLGRLRDGGKKREGRRTATVRVRRFLARHHPLGSSVVAYRTSVVHRPPRVRATVSQSVRAALIAEKNLLRTSDAAAAAAARKNLPTHPSPAAAFAFAAAAVTLAPT